MKKILCAVLALLMFAGVAGCSNSEGDSGSSNSSSSLSGQDSSLDASASGSGMPSSGLPASGLESSSSEPKPTSYTLTVPEGFTLARIGIRLEELGICTDEEFVEVAQTGDFSDFAVVAAIPYNENRAILLEGYLFPDTYEFYYTATPEDIIRRMLNNTEAKYATLAGQVAASGYNMDQIVAMASIIEKEGKGGEEMNMISSVLHNRLNAGWKLECDVTINYVNGVLGLYLEDGVERYKYYYNTYRCEALPAGAICNPGMAALQAALNPASTDYFFFLTDEDGNYYYGRNEAEHEENKVAAGLV